MNGYERAEMKKYENENDGKKRDEIREKCRERGN